MNNSIVFKDEIIHYFDFKDKYIGYVLDTSEFESKQKIKVFIPELFGYDYNPNINNIDKTVNISNSHIENKNDLIIDNSVERQEYVYAMVFPSKYYFTKEKEEFVKRYKPEVGETVVVSFFNGNPNNCIYEYKEFISDKDNIVNNINDNKNIKF